MSSLGTEAVGSITAIGQDHRPWWRHAEAWALVVLAAAIYLPRLADVPLRGEETRRGGIAIEMLRSGDWVVPRMQDSPVYYRPPLQNWAIALAGLMRGEVDAVAIRLPCVLSVIAAALLIYAYASAFLSRLGALAAGASFVTMGQVLELGRLGETDALLMSLLGASMLVWHYGRLRRWPAVCFWIAGYLLAALATLTKGIQGPIYFCSVIGVFLLLTGQWREALRWPHLVGIAVFLAVWGAWQIPYYRALGGVGLRHIYWDDVGQHCERTAWTALAKHIVSYPAEVLGCLLPWSVLLVAFVRRSFRQSLQPICEPLTFVTCAIAVTWPTCWFATAARGRYYMPLYPCFAVLIGVVIDRCCAAEATWKWRALWPQFLKVLALLMAGAGLFVAGATLVPHNPLGQPTWFAVAYGAVAIALAVLAWRSCRSTPRAWGVLSLAAFLGLTSSGVMANYLIHGSEPNAQGVAELKRQLPPGVRLKSLGRIDHLFAYYYRDPIELLPRSAAGEQAIAPGDYFCSGADNAPPAEVTFPYATIAVVSCDRWHADHGKRVVVVGRRLPSPEQRTTQASDARANLH